MIPIPITSNNYLNHLSYYYNIKDEEILSRRNNPNGIDAQKCLEQILERDLCVYYHI